MASLTPGSLPESRLAESPWRSDGIIREELFSIERLEQHAASLAAAQRVTARLQPGHSLKGRLQDNEARLLVAYRSLAGAARQECLITPAADWFIDNFHHVEAQIRQIHDDLPPRYYRQLPKLADGPFAGYPRVFGIAWACIAHSDSRFDTETLRRFVLAYQQVEALTIGELWAIAITLRIVLVENLRRAVDRITASREALDAADGIADLLLGAGVAARDPDALIRRHQAGEAFSPACVVQLVKRLRDQDPRETPALRWLEDLLVAQGTSAEQMVHDEHQRQGASNVTVRNIITSMRLISDVNWADFFEAVSPVDRVLRAGSGFDAMDFATRNLYRSAIEDLARGSKHTEIEVATAALERARADGDANRRTADPGYYLIARGRREFERRLGYRTPLRDWPRRLDASIGPMAYFCAIGVVTATVLALPLMLLAREGVDSGSLWLFGLLGLVPALDAALALVNRAVTRGIGATMLPGLALTDGVPAELRTMVVVPTLLTTPAAIAALIARLEVHHLASGPGELYFALLTDWTDAVAAHAPDDDALLDLAAAGIARLNRQYAAGADGARFHLLHRRRRWSESQGCWMGWERKRGKLHELNRLLRGATDTSFIAIAGQTPVVPGAVRFVVTLDTDTRLPRGAVARLVGKMAHPLNEPTKDATGRRVVDGYAVLQPRVTPSLPIGREGSLFQRVFSGMNGINAYDTAAADLYQDLFGAGSYAGKGIYDIEAFEAALADRVPEGSLLSHDLFEGTFARSGLVSDIEVVEEFPSGYGTAAARNHRWARGDWQLLPWIFGRTDLGTIGHRTLPLLGAWKMLDNLRRTLSAPTCLAALVAGWFLPLPLAAAWTLFVIATIALQPLLPALAALVPQRPGITWRSHLRGLVDDWWLAILQVVFAVSFLAHQAWLMVDAIVRTLYRLFISHRNLLEWVTAAQYEASEQSGLARTYLRMGGSVLFALGVMGLLGAAAAPGAWIAAPFLLLWIASPAIALRISVTPPVAGRLPLSAADSRELRLVARRTWRYFETFVTADDHMLPPDNFQEDPSPVVARRTSPTNLGLYLISIVSARDFGWLGTLDAAERLAATLASMGRLERHHGHFYNWYDTGNLQPLEPRYVSSVDSGNLAAHLIVLANACAEWRREPAPAFALACAGVTDALRLAQRHLDAAHDGLIGSSRAPIASAIDALLGVLLPQPGITNGVVARLSDMAARAAALHGLVQALDSAGLDDLRYWVEAATRTVASWRRDLQQTTNGRLELETSLGELETTAREMAMAMRFDFLLDAERRLLSIGYRADDGTLDPSCYDLLASEARLASFVAIAKNDVPTRHWFRLGRPVTPIGHGAALVSWSGSMFEYLMPSLVMRAPAGSLLEQTSRLIVRRQVEYGAEMQVPWGVSESAYSARDLALTYQYSNFGVPGLGLKRGLSRNVVIAPYATALAAMVDPHAATLNFARLSALGACGRYGYIEAIDYTPARLPAGARCAFVRAYMAHHQGMTIVALGNVLFDGRMRARFHAEPRVQATELVLQERTPRDLTVSHPRAEEVDKSGPYQAALSPVAREIRATRTATVQTQLLSNGSYAVMLTSAGSGYSHWRGLAITRWREDGTRDSDGQYLYLRDVHSGAVWSATAQPCGLEPDSYDVTFTEDRASYARRDGKLTTTLLVVVSPEDDVEVRRVSITNSGNGTRDIDVTSYAELVLAPVAADLAHPAFSKMFVQTEYLPGLGALLATRRRRDAADPEVWVGHQLSVEGEELQAREYDTDRASFIGRGRGTRAPQAIHSDEPLPNTVGTVLDPVFALRSRVRIPPGATVHLSYWTVVASSRASVCDLLDKHRDVNSYSRAATLAWTQAQAQLLHLGVTADEADLFQRLAGHVLYADPALRPASDLIVRGSGPRDALWAEGISGDRPIVLLRMEHSEDISVVRQLLQAHEYWRLKLLAVDLVILNERASSYVQDLQNAIETAVRMSQTRLHLGADGAHGAVFMLRTDLISDATRGVLSAVARVVLVAQRGSLAAQLDRLSRLPKAAPPPVERPRAPARAGVTPAPPALEYFNGLGGFGDDGREYVIHQHGTLTTPAPWINVLANPHFGCQLSADGAGYTWSLNSRENQLTAWSNDPVSDPPGEAIYVRDEQTGECWSPTRSPLPDRGGRYTTRHGHGYSVFEHEAADLVLSLLVFVPPDDPVRIARLTLRDTSGRARHLTVTAFIEWVLGTSRAASGPFVITSIDAATGALFATNPLNLSFGTRVAFVDLAGRQSEWTGDRREFIGRHGHLGAPAALVAGTALSMRVGAGPDPCAALRAPLEVPAHGSTEIVCVLGQGASVAEAQALVLRCRELDPDVALAAVTAGWRDTLGVLQVRTPDRAFDLMVNGWLLYQTLACRTWARSAFYQASGAYGFRDQLQDAMALVTARPDLLRAQLLRAAARQYPEGDVQHWWVPTTGQGVRTRISDDRIWLALATAHYIDSTGDTHVLDETLPFLDGPLLEPGAHDAFGQPAVTAYSASLFEHLARALDDSLAVGAHDLPLIGTGDWNDGMNRVGHEGRGESVWLGWFLHVALMRCVPLAATRDPARAARWEAAAAALRIALERDGWDGEWYRRGYFDDGTPLGSALSDECRIDSLAQSWSVISGVADPARAAQAMAAVDEWLIRRDDQLALLFTPPFEHTAHDPGYIKAYPPGLRENGGQYTHAATWSVIALAMLGDGAGAAALFSLLNPVNHAASDAGMRRYRVEPYVVAADVYSVAPHVGRGGWTWYTGAAGWLYRAGVEAILGLRRAGATLVLDPCIPPSWPRYEMTFRHGGTRYDIVVENPDGVARGVVETVLDGVSSRGHECRIPLGDDGLDHRVRVVLGDAAALRDE